MGHDTTPRLFSRVYGSSLTWTKDFCYPRIPRNVVMAPMNKPRPEIVRKKNDLSGQQHPSIQSSFWWKNLVTHLRRSHVGYA